MQDRYSNSRVNQDVMRPFSVTAAAAFWEDLMVLSCGMGLCLEVRRWVMFVVVMSVEVVGGVLGLWLGGRLGDGG